MQKMLTRKTKGGLIYPVNENKVGISLQEIFYDKKLNAKYLFIKIFIENVRYTTDEIWFILMVSMNFSKSFNKLIFEQYLCFRLAVFIHPELTCTICLFNVSQKLFRRKHFGLINVRSRYYYITLVLQNIYRRANVLCMFHPAFRRTVPYFSPLSRIVVCVPQHVPHFEHWHNQLLF